VGLWVKSALTEGGTKGNMSRTDIPRLVEAMKEIVGASFVLADEESKANYGHDETEDLLFLPDVVVRPRTPEEISSILVFCNKVGIPVTPRGAGTGLSGGALPTKGGVLLSTDRLNTIIQIDERNLQVTTPKYCKRQSRLRDCFIPPIPAAVVPVSSAEISLKTVEDPKR
jgi:hypothetical protein